MTFSTLPLAPETTTVSGTGASAVAGNDYWPWATPTRTTRNPAADGWVRGHDPRTVASGRARAQDPDYSEWLGHVRAASACKHPIRLAGQIHVNDADGNRMATVDTEDMPDGAIYTPCGNRRAAVCPSCAELYRRDTYHLIKAGLQGDRWGLPPLNEHIAIFLTATAPSFGPVHHRVVKVHSADCRKKDGCTCRPSVCHPFGRTCPHGQELRCGQRHKAADTQLGQPLCLDCYDHTGQVVWNHEAPELWRRTIQQADRELRRLGRTHGVDLRRRYIKVYEFQVRGVIHYHALIRLDGYNPDCPDAIVPPPSVVTRDMFEAAVRAAFLKTAYTSASHPANGGQGWRIAWGDKGLDLKHVNAPGTEVNLAQITGYIAKYVTKSTEVTGLSLRRVDDLSVEIHGDPATHLGRLIRACWDIGEHPDYARLRRWAHQFGYGGHIATKSRAFSVTLGFLRLQRTIWRRTEGHPHTWDDEQTERVIYELGYQATGWITTGDALLANTAAAMARAQHLAGIDALADELAAARAVQPLAA
ncbi:plasmid replication initiator protein RepSA [Micromonospora arborensis]|uniref:Plasmid replication initiator protein RepSA n=1 Tax=Micromonospora arborensis TaxID=2116518 RepID=A0A318NI09_9ACTN|nr:replication initiator [Micromonospora arborensis]PYC69194.1 plasmid replication initiator protein RepSA [Micromonospora arborensis]